MQLSSAFSLVEIVVVMALLSVIVLGLMAMFTQTQRAFRAGLTSTDVLESGRLAADLLGREFREMAPAGQQRGLTAFPYLGEPVNFYSWLPDVTPFYQPLPGSDINRTNLLEDVFFVYRNNQEWIGIGYFVRTNDPGSAGLTLPTVSIPGKTFSGVGSLYRFQTNALPLSNRTVASLYRDFYDAAYNGKWPASKIVDGVMHFKVRAYNDQGYLITQNLTNKTTDILFATATSAPDEIGRYYFFSNAAPAAVEFELGVLEDRAWQHFKALPPTPARYNYLTNQAGRVHLFRERVPIRNADPIAYQ